MGRSDPDAVESRAWSRKHGQAAGVRGEDQRTDRHDDGRAAAHVTTELPQGSLEPSYGSAARESSPAMAAQGRSLPPRDRLPRAVRSLALRARLHARTRIAP